MKPEERNAELLRSAEILRQGDTYRPFVEAPLFLIEREYEEGEGASDGDVMSLIRATWESFTYELERGNYGNLLLLLERLKDRLEESRGMLEERNRELRTALLLKRIYQQEGEEYGMEATLSDSLKVLTEGNKGNNWTWRGWAVQAVHGPPHEWLYTLEIDDVRIRSSGADRDSLNSHGYSKYVKSIKGTRRWGELVESLSRKYDRAEKRHEAARRHFEILQFRMSVLEAVLWDYETYGVVSPLTKEEVERLLDEDTKRLLRRVKLSHNQDFFFEELDRLHVMEQKTQKEALARLKEELDGFPQFFKGEDDESLLSQYRRYRKKKPGG